MRTPQLPAFASLQPVIFVLLFRYVFGRGHLRPGQTADGGLAWTSKAS